MNLLPPGVVLAVGAVGHVVIDRGLLAVPEHLARAAVAGIEAAGLDEKVQVANGPARQTYLVTSCGNVGLFVLG